MTVAELATCRVPMDHALPAPMGGYVMACSAFYKRGFSKPSHRFLRLLLQYYGLELHHLTPLGILHIAAFVTLCEAQSSVASIAFADRMSHCICDYGVILVRC
jgi:hypothetical protein